MLNAIRDAIRGKKTYILGTIAVLTAVVAWASGELTLSQGVAAMFVAVQSMFIRAGIANG